jgi:hypothetical protein
MNPPKTIALFVDCEAFRHSGHISFPGNERRDRTVLNTPNPNALPIWPIVEPRYFVRRGKILLITARGILRTLC